MRNLPAGKAFRSYTLATIYIDQGKDREAETILKELLLDDPDNERIHETLANVLQRLRLEKNERVLELVGQWARMLVFKAHKCRLEDIAISGIGNYQTISVKERMGANER